MEVIVLASQSPRRRELLQMLGLSIETAPADIDETPLQEESAADFVLRMAKEKAEAVLPRFPQRLIIASDTAVVVDGEIWGKPENKSHYESMMQRLSGREHQVLTSVCILRGSQIELELNQTQVFFRVLSADEIEAYWQSGEPQDKAGGYGIQGRASLFIDHIEGSFHGVMGLPLHVVGNLLQRFDYPLWEKTAVIGD